MEQKQIRLVDCDGKGLSDDEVYRFLKAIADEEWINETISKPDNKYFIIVDELKMEYRELGG